MLALALVGVALWIGSLPGTLTTSAGTSIVGCDQPRSENAADVCPELICKKALREHSEIDDRAEISLAESFFSVDDRESIHVGKAHWKKEGKVEQRTVRCLMQGDTVVKSGPITSDELNSIVQGKWL
jgi:hypothetical protein